MKAILVKLYIKTHLDTGLKYFGRTVQNIYKYQGSGKYWTRHIKKHTYNVKTELYGEFYEDDPLLVEVSLDFSIRNNIVNSNEWANLSIEDGLHSGNFGYTITDETRKKLSENSLGKTHSVETKEKMSIFRIGFKHTESSKEKMSKNRIGLKYSEETKKKMSISKTGMKLSEETKKKIGKGNKGKILSEETKKKISNSKKGVSSKKVKCPHCNKEGGAGAMSLWHFNNCKNLI